MRVLASAREACSTIATHETARMLGAVQNGILSTPLVNTAVVRRRLADEAVARGRYPFA
jgi:hypothetical protein